ncbi:MAG: SufD family Fe-S cluster assembly protein, partial [Ardenticatenia bacterium]|nr:SufD family Fe-S cluster assembly protein [Ardenticatenia bacterium]
MAELIAPQQIQQEDATALADVGVDTSEQDRSATYVLRDHLPLCVVTYIDGLEMLPIAQALEKYDWLREDYFWKAVPADKDDITAQVAADPEPQGYFIRVKKGVKIKSPAQAALYMAHGGTSQKVHNVVILEEDSELHLITGCTTAHQVRSGLHLAASEMYIGKNATLTNTMVHSWGPEVVIRPRAATVVEDDGRFISNYVALRPGLDIQSNPHTYLNGRGASAKYLTIILGSQGAIVDTGGGVYPKREGPSAELAPPGGCTRGPVRPRGVFVGHPPRRGPR